MTLPLRWPIICSALVALAAVLPQIYAAPQDAPAGHHTSASDLTEEMRTPAVAAPHCEHYVVLMERSYLVWCPPRSGRY
jgi:hypothetical protein